jgi:hypothetical protein
LTSTVDIRDLRKEDTAEKARVIYRPCAEAAARRTAPLKTPGKNGIDSGRLEALGLTIWARPDDMGAALPKSIDSLSAISLALREWVGADETL